VLDRLTVAQTGNPVTHTQQFSYDANGNRQNATLDGAVANLSYAPTGNQLQLMTGVVNANYFNGATALTFGYNNANRLVQVQSSGVTIGAYAVNALGQRVSKTAAGITTLFVYDEQGHLLGEYDATGTLIQETVWLEELPVATLRPTGSGNPTPIAIYYVHADHLGSPRAVTRPSDNAIMWQWNGIDPFGNNAADENPSGRGVFKYAMRFPGQYYDTETGTHYNYYRDYDPTIGRYEQSDPIGLRAGLNTYLYVRADPPRRRDPLGLETMCDPTGSGYCSEVPDIDLTAGCGSGSLGPIIPNAPPWAGASFLKCCDNHDHCYDDCEKPRSKIKCDGNFCSCLRDQCSGSSNPTTCKYFANKYCIYGTTGDGPTKAFNDSGKKCDGPRACIPSKNKLS
jgi:RHS repeat-associated protein